MAARDVKAGGAFVELGVRDKLKRGLLKAQARLKAFGQTVRGIGSTIGGFGSAVGGTILAATQQFANFGDQLHKMALRTNVSATSLSQLKFAAEQSGASLEQLGNGLFRMQRRVANAALGTGPAVRALKELGLNAKSLNALNPERQMKLIADELAKVGDDATAAQLAFEIFGNSAKPLVPLLKEGAAGIERLQKEADSLGLTLDDEAAGGAAAFSDALNRLRQSMRAIAIQIGAAVAPALTAIAKRVQPIISAVIQWVRENKTAVVAIGALAAAATAAGFALITFGGIVAAIGFVVGAIATPLGVVVAILTAVVGAIAAVAAHMSGLIDLTALGAQAWQLYVKAVDDIWRQVPEIIAFWWGRALRAAIDMAVSFATSIGSLFKKLFTAIFTGDFSGFAEIFRKISSVGQSFSRGFSKGSAPEFNFSGETKAAFDSLRGELATQRDDLTGKLRGATGAAGAIAPGGSLSAAAAGAGASVSREQIKAMTDTAGNTADTNALLAAMLRDMRSKKTPIFGGN